jgi:CBS domain-containing protein
MAEEECPGPPELESVLLQDTLREVELNPALVVDEHASLAECIELMRVNQQPCVLVTADGKLVGIFTEHDLLMKVMDSGFDLQSTEVRSCMTSSPATLPADAGVAYALNRMVIDGFHRLPLVDPEGRPVGIVSMSNIIGYLSTLFPKDVLNLPPDPTKLPRQREGA